MPFVKGQSGNPNGKPAGIKNKSTLDIKAVLDSEVDFRQVVKKLLELVMGVTVQTKHEGETIVYERPPDAHAAKILLEYRFGRPTQSIDLGDTSFILQVNTRNEQTKALIEG